MSYLNHSRQTSYQITILQAYSNICGNFIAEVRAPCRPSFGQRPCPNSFPNRHRLHRNRDRLHGNVRGEFRDEDGLQLRK